MQIRNVQRKLFINLKLKLGKIDRQGIFNKFKSRATASHKRKPED